MRWVGTWPLSVFDFVGRVGSSAPDADEKPIVSVTTAQTGWLSAYDSDGAKALDFRRRHQCKGGILGRQDQGDRCRLQDRSSAGLKAATEVVQKGPPL